MFVIRSVLRGGQRKLRRVQRWLRPPAPPHADPFRSPELNRVPLGVSFITGNGIAAHCRHVLNFGDLELNEGGEDAWWFCHGDLVEYFFRHLAPREPFVLFSHNSDRPIGEQFRRRLGEPRVIAWFAQNPTIADPKLRALPIGIANPRWSHGDQDVLRRVQAEPPAKTQLFNASFSLQTNVEERSYCLEQTGVELESPRPFEEHLRALASAYFCISPSGNGIDVHRTWEALYLRTIPVVTRSVLTDQHSDLPMIVLDEWAQFRTIPFSPELYARTWDAWDPAAIQLDRYLERVRRTIRDLGGG